MVTVVVVIEFVALNKQQQFVILTFIQQQFVFVLVLAFVQQQLLKQPLVWPVEQ